MIRRALASLVLLTACKSGGEPATPPPPVPASAPASQPSSAPASQPSFTAAIPTETATIAAPDLRAHVYTLADDAYEGRGPDTKGIHQAAEYLERALIDLKLEPAFDRRYRQPFTMAVAVEVKGTPQLTSAGKSYAFGRDFAAFPFSRTGDAEGALAFAGFGVTAKDLEYDDYAGLDVKDRIVVVLSGEPGDEDNKSPFDGRRPTRHSFLRTKAVVAREAGAKALLVVREKPLEDTKRFDAESDAGIITLPISAAAAKRLLGFDPLAKKKAIDKAYKPASQLVDKRAKLSITLARIERTVENVGAVLRGSEDGAVVIGAHYDHLGYGGSSSLSGDSTPRIHNGADDNASGTAVVLEVARAMKKAGVKPKRSVYFFLFAGEEAGLLGSSFLVKHPPLPMSEVVAMVNLDMVGRLRDDKLNVMGTKTAEEWLPFLETIVKRYGVKGSFGGDGYGPSDQTSFYAEQVPVLHMFTGAHGDYHKPSDDPDTLNYQGMAKVAAIAHDIVEAIANADGRLSYVQIAAPVATGGGHGYGPYFGSIPDFGDSPDGVLLSGVREGSPADLAGVKKGDVIVEFGGVAVHNLQDFTVALRRCAPGDEVEVKVKRGEEVLTVKAKLTKRGG